MPQAGHLILSATQKPLHTYTYHPMRPHSHLHHSHNCSRSVLAQIIPDWSSFITYKTPTRRAPVKLEQLLMHCILLVFENYLRTGLGVLELIILHAYLKLIFMVFIFWYFSSYTNVVTLSSVRGFQGTFSGKRRIFTHFPLTWVTFAPSHLNYHVMCLCMVKSNEKHKKIIKYLWKQLVKVTHNR